MTHCEQYRERGHCWSAALERAALLLLTLTHVKHNNFIVVAVVKHTHTPNGIVWSTKVHQSDFQTVNSAAAAAANTR